MWSVISNSLSQHAPFFCAARAEKWSLSQHAPFFATSRCERKLQVFDNQAYLQTTKSQFQHLISVPMLSQHAPVSPQTYAVMRGL